MLTFISVFTPVHIRERRHPGTGQAENQAPDNNPAACTKKERGKPSASRSCSQSEITPSRLAFTILSKVTAIYLRFFSYSKKRLFLQDSMYTKRNCSVFSFRKSILQKIAPAFPSAAFQSRGLQSTFRQIQLKCNPLEFQNNHVFAQHASRKSLPRRHRKKHHGSRRTRPGVPHTLQHKKRELLPPKKAPP